MKENLKYINHLNEVFEFAAEEAYVFESDLHDYSWDVVEKNNRITGFRRGLGKKSIPLCLHCSDPARGFELRNKLFEIAEKDVFAKIPGRLEMNGYFLECYITASKKSAYLYRKRHMAVSLEVTAEYPFWCKEKTISYLANSGTVQSGGLDYPTDFSFDYLNSVNQSQVVNEDFIASKFRLTIYGECVNPSIAIGGQIYQVNCAVGTGERLVIDGKDKKIYLINSTGERINKFKDRYKKSYVFEPIPSGGNSISWNGAFGFDITLIEERSEPKWI